MRHDTTTGGRGVLHRKPKKLGRSFRLVFYTLCQKKTVNQITDLLRRMNMLTSTELVKFSCLFC